MRKPVKKVCSIGHTYFKSSDCPVCPRCETARLKGQVTDLPKISAPATRALHSIGVTTLSQLTKYSEQDLLELHGMGSKAVSLIKEKLTSIKSSLRKP